MINHFRLKFRLEIVYSSILYKNLFDDIKLTKGNSVRSEFSSILKFRIWDVKKVIRLK